MPKKLNLLVFLPFLVFAGLAIMFGLQIASERDPSLVPSPLVGQPTPIMTLEPLQGSGVPGLEGDVYSGRVSLVNIWASWCAPCREEHPLLMTLSDHSDLQLFGINYKDDKRRAANFLKKLGNPYDRVGADPMGRASIEWGVYGVPETFLIGPDGVIAYKHVGPLTAKILIEEILPLAKSLTKGGV